MIGVALFVLVPIALGALVGRRREAVVLGLVAGTIIFWLPQGMSAGDDWRPIVYPIYVAWLIAAALAGVALRRHIGEHST